MSKKPVPYLRHGDQIRSYFQRERMEDGAFASTEVVIERAPIFEEVEWEGDVDKVVGRWTPRESGVVLYRATAVLIHGWAFAISPREEEVVEVINTFLSRGEANGYWALGDVQFEAKLDLERAAGMEKVTLHLTMHRTINDMLADPEYELVQCESRDRIHMSGGPTVFRHKPTGNLCGAWYMCGDPETAPRLECVWIPVTEREGVYRGPATLPHSPSVDYMFWPD